MQRRQEGQRRVETQVFSVYLSHVDDGAGKADLAVVVAGVLGNVARKLGHLDLLLELALQAAEEHLKMCSRERDKIMKMSVSCGTATKK